MATGLIALLDDVAAIAKVAAASLDDVATQAAKAGMKAAGVVIDDAAVTPRYVVGFAASRELPIVRRIAIGSLRNKLIFLLPAALALSLFAPWAITPLLMLGGAYLCYEGAEKVFEALFPHAAHGHEVAIGIAAENPQVAEDAKVRAAISTDFILSAEIMAIALATLPEASFLAQALILAVVGIGITVVVYGAVALIVKADDVGLAMANNPTPVSHPFGEAAPDGQNTAADRALRPFTQALGRGVVRGMPSLLKALAIIGTVAMLWVGGGIVIHGLEEFGVAAPGHAMHWLGAAAGAALPAIGGAAQWFGGAVAAAVFGLALGLALIPVAQYAVAPLVAWARAGR